MDLFKLSQQVEQYVIDLRREFHMNPEISFQETRTTARIKEELDKAGIPHVTVGRGNVVGIFDTGKPGKSLAIRADIDALPMDEVDKTRPHCSKVEGVMHSCGHDGHTAMLLGTAKLLPEIKDALTGKVYLCFQVAEEVGGGADEIVAWLKEQGGVDACIGTHLDGGSDAGVINLPDGPMMAGAYLFEIFVKGVGGHGSRPDKCVDPVKPACDILLKIASIPAQYHNPFDTCVISPCLIQGGTAWNIVPEIATIKGNIRFFKYGDEEKLFERIRMVVENTAAAYGTTAEVKFTVGSRLPVINNPEMAALGREIAQQVGFQLAPPHDPTCGSDNYADFLEAFPGFYCDTGANCKAPGASGNHHNPHFDLDESAFRRVVEFFCAFAVRFLGE
ncbi:MAG: amidohydrolase [Clostridia bacterium]|nr:amidohydrolase [Clostridia bacterium]MBQ3076459.1 amidohydrolase [Clostridia bacterium]